jgi:hypothetical protein
MFLQALKMIIVKLSLQRVTLVKNARWKEGKSDGETYLQPRGGTAYLCAGGGPGGLEGGVKEEGRTVKIEEQESCGGKVGVEGLALWIYCCGGWSGQDFLEFRTAPCDGWIDDY